MKLAVLLNGHSSPELIRDTLDSIYTYASRDVIFLTDGAHWNKFKDLDLGAAKLCGFCHNVPKAPYRNVALGLQTLMENHADADWFCYTEEDVVFASDRFKRNLEIADEKNVWMLGNDGRIDENAVPLMDAMLDRPVTDHYYFLGCCQFFSKKFAAELKRINFFERFLHLTNGFDRGYMPSYSGYDVSETMYPSLCRHFGGNVGVFASYSYDTGKWHGAYRYFPMRWRPELDPQTEDFEEASILHPLKLLSHPIRIRLREKRNANK